MGAREGKKRKVDWRTQCRKSSMGARKEKRIGGSNRYLLHIFIFDMRVREFIDILGSDKFQWINYSRLNARLENWCVIHE